MVKAEASQRREDRPSWIDLLTSPGGTLRLVEVSRRAAEAESRRELKLNVYTGCEALSVNRLRSRIPTGSSALDRLLSGGVEVGLVTELIGGSATGKTQLCFQLSLNAARRGWRTLYVDTAGSFRPERIAEIASMRGYAAEEILEIFRLAELLELEVLGFYHSHPFHGPFWSATDDERSKYWIGYSFLIFSLPTREVRCYFRVNEEKVEEEPVVIE